MKRFIMFSTILLSCILLNPTKVVAQRKKCEFRSTICINGYWGAWEDSFNSNFNSKISYIYFNGVYDNFIIHDSKKHPSNYIMKVVIDHFKLDTDKKSKKQRIKNNTWYEYSGTVEYYTELTFQNFEDLASTWPHGAWDTSNGKKHVVKAKIKIAPYEDYPRVYNIWFEQWGVGIRPKW